MSLDAQFISKWFSSLGTSRFDALAELEHDPDGAIRWDWLLQFPKQHLSPFGAELLQHVQETGEPQPLADLGRGYHAYLQFQDLLPIELDGDSNRLLQQHHAYYESLVYLRRLLLVVFDRHVLASYSLMRPFLELAVTELYWTTVGLEDGWAEYGAWLSGKRQKPHFKAMVLRVFSGLPDWEGADQERLELLRETLLQSYRSACAYHHTPLPHESILSAGGGNIAPSALPFYGALFQAELVVRQIVLLYVLVKPMILFPVDSIQKFGFSGPVGVFADRVPAQIVDTYLGEETANSLRRFLSNDPNVVALLNWYGNFPDVAEEQLEQDWQELKSRLSIDRDADDLRLRECFFRAHFRALAWAMSYRDRGETEPEVSDEQVAALAKAIRDWP